MTKQQMTDYLRNHFRYDTMNSWNQATSYAVNVKLHRLKWKTPELANAAYEFLDIREAYDDCNAILRDFALRHDWQWQICFNGRSSGYLVLIHGGYKLLKIAPADMKPGDRHYSDRIGRWFDYEEARDKGWLGKDWKQIYTRPGMSVDHCETFDDWDMDALRVRVALVREFDNVCENAVRAFQDFVELHDTVVIEVPSTSRVKVAVPRKSGDMKEN